MTIGTTRLPSTDNSAQQYVNFSVLTKHAKAVKPKNMTLVHTAAIKTA